MKVKICNLLRATTYLELIVAILTLTGITYDALMHSDLGFGIISLLVIMICAALQTVYSITVIRLIHYYAPSQKIPDHSFLKFYDLLSKLNTVIAVGLSFWFVVQLAGFVHLFNQQTVSDPQTLLQICITGSYAIISIYTIAGAAKLKQAILQQHDWQIDSWLEEIGHVATVQSSSSYKRLFPTTD